MPSTAASKTQPLVDTPEHGCPLCAAPLPTKGLLHTPDFLIFVRDGHVAQLTYGEATVLRALFKSSGFRLTRGQLLDQMYVGTDPPLNAEHVLRMHCMNLRQKFLPLNMGLGTEGGVITLCFMAPKASRVCA